MSKTVSIEVVRAFYYQGKPAEVGKVLHDVPIYFAAELIAARKAKAHEPAPPPAPAEEPPKAAARGKTESKDPAQPEGVKTHAR